MNIHLPKSREKNSSRHYITVIDIIQLLHCLIYNVKLQNNLMKSGWSFVMSCCYFSATSFLRCLQLSPSHTPYLNNKIPPPKVCNSPGQPCSAPHKTQEERSLCVGEGFHHFPEPLYQGSSWLNAFVSCYRFQEMKWNIWASTYLKNKRVIGYTSLIKSIPGDLFPPFF